MAESPYPRHDPDLPADWAVYYSKSRACEYFFNVNTGESLWERPIKRKHLESNNSIETKDNDNATSKRSRTDSISSKLGVIVPFRDIHVEQNRSEHLRQFVAHMTEFFQSSSIPCEVLIIEQTNDGKKFNRGKLLNIGFELAKERSCNIFVFHDVDLLPSLTLLPFYTSHSTLPMHIARLWPRYADNPNYFGGIVKFNQDQFQQVNGFPNNFWGWGGEDDELILRVKSVCFCFYVCKHDFDVLIHDNNTNSLNIKCGMQTTSPSIAPSPNLIIDLESLELSQKLSILRSHTNWKCLNKSELLSEHSDTWRNNGLSNLKYTVVSVVELKLNVKKFSIELGLNYYGDGRDDWTNRLCGVDDERYGRAV